MGYLRNLAMLAVLSAGSSAWAASPSTADLLACLKVPDDPQRLACFDRQATALEAAQDSRGSVAAPSATTSLGAAPSAAAPAAKLTPEQKIGLSHEKVEALEAPPGAPPQAQIKDFTAVIKNVSVDGRNRQVYELDNGQVWHQSETKPSFDAHAGDAVRISKGALGSFFLEVQTNKHFGTRVSRVR